MQKKIFTTARVKNEDDIIESFVRYNLTYCDGMLINDNGSVDDTKEIIQKLIYEGLPVFFADTGNKTELAHIAVKEYGADLVIALDADEFLYHTDGINPRGVLESLNENLEYQAYWRTYVYEHEPDISLGFMPNNFTSYRNPIMENQDNYRFLKAIVSKKLLVSIGVTYSPGGHSLIYPNEYSGYDKVVEISNLVYAHFPIRSKSQLTMKAVSGRLAKCKTYRPDDRYANYVQMGVLFNKIKTKGEIPYEELRQCSIEYSMHPDYFADDKKNVASREKLDELLYRIGNNVTIPGSMNTSFCAERLKLRYTKYRDDNKIVMRAIANEIDLTAMYLHNELEDKKRKISELTITGRYAFKHIKSDAVLIPGVISSWIDIELHGNKLTLSDWFKVRNIHNAAIYGAGVIGKLLVSELVHSKQPEAGEDLNIYLIDTHLAGQQYLSYDVYTPDKFFKPVDAILIAVADPGYVKEIKSVLTSGVIKYNRILTLHDMISGRV